MTYNRSSQNNLNLGNLNCKQALLGKPQLNRRDERASKHEDHKKKKILIQNKKTPRIVT